MNYDNYSLLELEVLQEEIAFEMAKRKAKFVNTEIKNVISDINVQIEEITTAVYDLKEFCEQFGVEFDERILNFTYRELGFDNDKREVFLYD